MKVNKAAEALYEEYLESGAGAEDDELNNRWRKASAAAEDKMYSGTLTCEDLSTYEEAVAHAAFYAGLRAGVAFTKGGIA